MKCLRSISLIFHLLGHNQGRLCNVKFSLLSFCNFHGKMTTSKGICRCCIHQISLERLIYIYRNLVNTLSYNIAKVIFPYNKSINLMYQLIYIKQIKFVNFVGFVVQIIVCPFLWVNILSAQCCVDHCLSFSFGQYIFCVALCRSLFVLFFGSIYCLRSVVQIIVCPFLLVNILSAQRCVDYCLSFSLGQYIVCVVLCRSLFVLF